MRTKQIAFVPQWIDDSLRRRGLASEHLLDFEKIAPLFSIEDLATIVVLEEKSSIFTTISVRSDSFAPLSVWANSAKTDKSKKLIGDIATMAAQKDFAAECLQRLFTQQPASPEKDQKETFEVSLLGSEGVKVVIKQGFPVQAHAVNALPLFRCVVKQLYVYEEYYQLISRPIGRSYIETLLLQ